TIDKTIDQQVEMDEALVPHARRLRIGRSNFRLLLDISSKESTLQLVYDVLRLTPFFKAFLVTTDVLEIYMQEFWATATVHDHSIQFKMDNKKHIVNLESFKEMHSGEIRRLTDVNINKLHQPWRSFVAIRNVDFVYLLWEDFVYQVEHKDTKKSNEMYYPRFKKNTQQFGAMLPIELTNADIRNSDAYKEYYAVATGATPPKTKASVAMTEAQQLKLATKRSLQQIHISQASGSGIDEGTSTILGVPDVPTEESNEEISWKSSDEGDDNDDDEQGDDGDDDQEENDDDDDAQDDDADEENEN
nr:hypothetical protein [Tanacetum cinerariifolium]